TVVPLLPASSEEPGCRRPRRPLPLNLNDCERSGILTPSARRTLAVDRTSADSRIPEICDSPLASAPRIRARCDIDLSPGTRIVPRAVISASLRELWHCPSCHRDT